MENFINGEQPINEAGFNLVETKSINQMQNAEDKMQNDSEILKTENDAETGSLKLKKFKTVKDLEQAYENLEAEFTKKSQKLKDLEKQESMKSKEQGIKSNVEIVNDAKEPEPDEKTEEDFSTKADDDLLAYLKTNEELKSSFLKDYFDSLLNNAPPVVISGRHGSFMPAKEKTILDFNEAQEAVKKIFE